jgi:tetratricopeptide (TPR) repeat protein
MEAPARQLLMAFALTVLAPLALWADVVVLKSGERLEGKVVSESDAEVVMEVEVTAGIIEPRTIARSDITELQKKSPADLAYEQIQTIKPGANAMAVETYDQIIARLNKFAQAFPDSPYTPEVKSIIAEFRKEKERVVAGEFKLENRWLAAEEVEKKRYQIAAQLLFDRMKDLSARGDLIGALNTFDAIETQHSGARAYPEAVAIAKHILVTLQAEVTRLMQALKFNTEEWKKNIELATERERTKLKAAAEAEQKQYEAALAAAQKSRVKWNPLIPKSQKSLETLDKLIPTEAQRIATIPVESMRKSVDLVAQANAAVERGDLETAEGALKQALIIWPQNEAASQGQKEVAERQAAAKATATPSPGAHPGGTPAGATPSPSPAASPAGEKIREPSAALRCKQSICAIVGQPPRLPSQVVASEALALQF